MNTIKEAKEISELIQEVKLVVGSRLLTHQNPTASMATFANLLAVEVLGSLIEATDKQLEIFAENTRRGVEVIRRTNCRRRRASEPDAPAGPASPPPPDE